MPFVVVTSLAPEIKSRVEKILRENNQGIELEEFQVFEEMFIKI